MQLKYVFLILMSSFTIYGDCPNSYYQCQRFGIGVDAATNKPAVDTTDLQETIPVAVGCKYDSKSDTGHYVGCWTITNNKNNEYAACITRGKGQSPNPWQFNVVDEC